MRLIGTTLAAALVAGAVAGLAAPSPAAAQTDQNGNWLRNQLNGLLNTGPDNGYDAQRRAYEAGRRDQALQHRNDEDWRQRRADEGDRWQHRDEYGSDANRQDGYHYSWRDHVGRNAIGGADNGYGAGYGNTDRPNDRPYGQDYGTRNYGGTSDYNYNR